MDKAHMCPSCADPGCGCRKPSLVARYAPPPPPGVDPPIRWGDREVVRTRLGERVHDLAFDTHPVAVPALSPQHYRIFMEGTAAPIRGVVQALSSQPERLATFRKETEEVYARHFHDNLVVMDALLTRGRKRAT